MNIYSLVNKLRDTYTPVSNTSNFRKTGQLTPKEFVAAGDYLVFKFPTWQWAVPTSSSLLVPYLPPDKQFLVTRNVPCPYRVDFAGGAGPDSLVGDGDNFKSPADADADDDGWLRTGSLINNSRSKKAGQDNNSGDVAIADEDGLYEADDIPDMEDDDDDDAIIRDDDNYLETVYRYAFASPLPLFPPLPFSLLLFLPFSLMNTLIADD